MRKIVLIIYNLRSAHNVGSLLRTADGFGVSKVYLCGYTPYPAADNDDRLPHVRQKTAKSINKTALGAENSIDWEHQADIKSVLDKLAMDGYIIAALEQTPAAINLPAFKPKGDIALIVGNEVDGIDSPTLRAVKHHVKIPMLGQKESFNVSVAGAIALYQLHYH